MNEEPSDKKVKDGRLAYLQSVIDNITDIVTILSADGTVLYESRSIQPTLGYTPEEMLGKNIFTFIHPDDYKRVFQLFLKTLLTKGKVEKTELRFKRKDGGWAYLECVGKNLLFDPSVRGAVISSRDISARREHESQLKLQSAALEAAFNGIVITDAQGDIVWINSAFTRMTGYALEEVLGKNPRILKSGEQPPQAYQELWQTILRGETWIGEVINRRKDGSLYFEKMTIAPLRDLHGRISHFIAVKEDISLNKRLESQFRQAQKMEAVGLLAGGVAHDFNNLLTVIIGQANLVLTSLPPGDPLRESVEEINKAGVRAAGLTRQLLAFGRRQVLQPKVLDLNELVRGADKMLRRLVGENIELVTMFGEKLKSVKVDAGQIEQVLMNLVVNARDAMPEGGKLVFETVMRVLSEKQLQDYPGMTAGEYVQLSVGDTGSGMSDEVKAHLFEPFFTTKEKGKGTGLGLATVYGIIKQSRGFIYAESRPGKGSVFRIFLPPSEEAPAVPDAVKSVPMPGGSEVVLLAEDEELLRGLIVQVLTRQGFHVVETKNGLEALDAARAHKGAPIRMLITDMVMPHMGGNELAENFLKIYPDTKVIFSSGYTDHAIADKWIKRGYPFLQKPYTIAELLLTVRETLDRPVPKG